MENRAYALAAGLFTILLGIGVVATALWFSGDAVENDEYVLISRYPVSGLNPQAPVRYRGVTVGKVVDIKFDQQEARAILVRILVQAGTPLTEGTFARLGSQGVTGLSYVMLDDDGKKPAPLVSSTGAPPRIEVRPSFIDSLSASGEEMIVNFNQVAKRVNVLLSDEIAREPGKVVPVADLILQVAPARLALPHPNRATIIAGLERNDLSDRAVVDALNRFTESVGVPKAQA